MSTSKKALLVTTVSGFVPQFEMNHVRLLQSMGYEVHYAANFHTPSYGDDNSRLDGTGIICHQIDFVRSPFRPENVRVFLQLTRLMREISFDLVHCHTPMGGVMARLVARTTKTAPVIYTAHGFHFFDGAPLVNWLCYYPMELLLSYLTDQQICINREDYERAKAKFRAKYTDYIPGVGIDLSRIRAFDAIDPIKKRQELALPTDKFLVLSSGELIPRKNHETALRAVAGVKDAIPNLHYVICGHGALDSKLKALADELHISDRVTFLGYRTDMLEIYRAADLFLFPSYQEGLPMALLEAMASGLAVICSDIRGSHDLMEPIKTDGALTLCKGGILIDKADHIAAYEKALRLLATHPEELCKMGQANALRAESFTCETVTQIMEKIYRRIEQL